MIEIYYIFIVWSEIAEIIKLLIEAGELKVISSIEHKKGIKSGTFAASPSSHVCFAFGDLGGNLNILDLEK